MAKKVKKALGNDPLFNPEGYTQKPTPRSPGGSLSVVSKETVEQMGKAYKELKRALRSEKKTKKEDSGEFTRMTFIIRRDQLAQLRSYAQENGTTIKEALGQALGIFFGDQKTGAEEREDREFLKAFKSADEKTKEIIKMLLNPSSQK